MILAAASRMCIPAGGTDRCRRQELRPGGGTSPFGQARRGGTRTCSCSAGSAAGTTQTPLGAKRLWRVDNQVREDAHTLSQGRPLPCLTGGCGFWRSLPGVSAGRE